MTTLTVTTNADYRGATLSGPITKIVYNTSVGAVAFFNVSQFDGTQISPNVQFVEDSHPNQVDVYMAPGDGSFSIAGWKLASSPDLSITLFGSTAADTITGSDANGANIIGGKGADTLIGGAQFDSFEYDAPNELRAGESVDGGDSGDNNLYLRGTGTYNFAVATLARLTAIQFSGSSNEVAKFTASQVGPGLINSVFCDTSDHDTLVVTGQHVNLASMQFVFGWLSSDVVDINGTSGADTLIGSAKNDVINGGSGTDQMEGGRGNDTYVVNTSTDIVDEQHNHGSGKADLVESSVTFSLEPSAQVLGDVENLTLTGHHAIKGTGNSLANVITGNDANNRLTGGDGADRFVFNTTPGSTNLDHITDFTHASDTIALSKAIFGPLTVDTNTLYAAAGAVTAHDADDRIVYNTSNGALYFDKDGKDGTPAVEFAVLNGHPTIDPGDFVVIA